MNYLFGCRSTSVCINTVLVVWMAFGGGIAPRQRTLEAGQLQGKPSPHLLFEEEQPRPLTMVLGDFDEDGVGDLAIGYALTNGGSVAVLQGNIDAHAPQTQQSWLAAGLHQYSDPYFRSSKPISLASKPDFMIAADVNGDGHVDLVFCYTGQ